MTVWSIALDKQRLRPLDFHGSHQTSHNSQQASMKARTNAPVMRGGNRTSMYWVTLLYKRLDISACFGFNFKYTYAPVFLMIDWGIFVRSSKGGQNLIQVFRQICATFFEGHFLSEGISGSAIHVRTTSAIWGALKLGHRAIFTFEGWTFLFHTRYPKQKSPRYASMKRSVNPLKFLLKLRNIVKAPILN